MERQGRLRRQWVKKGTAQGQMMFWDETLQTWVHTEVTELFWDDVNKRLGINKATLTYPLDVTGIIRGSAFRTSSNDFFGFGLIETLKMRSTSGDDRGKLEHVYATGSLISRNIADANPTFKIQNLHASSTGDILQLQNNTSTVLAVLQGGNLGIGETAPETLTEWTHAQPYLTLHNSTHEDADGGRESRLNFRGEQSGGELTTLARIEVSHDGSADDEKGKVVISTNEGSDADTPTEALTIDSARNIKASGNTISDSSGNLTSANGANFGPAGVTSITVVNGIVTAIS